MTMMVTSIFTKTEWSQKSIRKEEKIGVRAKWGQYDRVEIKIIYNWRSVADY